jgi:pimeloyl-ACP methyl ester carboxylesterase
MKTIFHKAIVISLIMMLVATITPALAMAQTVTPGNSNGVNYIQVTGKIGNADYVVYIPQHWNGRLIIGCPGYNYYQTTHPELGFDALAKMLVANGYMFAVSNYNGGERAWLTELGIVRIHQLTEYLIWHYHVTGKIFLAGFSMGGGIALLLGEKYPMLYSGVLDVCGNKGDPFQYQYAEIFITHTIPEIRAILGLPDAVTDQQIASLQDFFKTIVADKIEALHGTPEQRPCVYNRENTLLHAHIRIPVISVVGGIDPIVPLQAHLDYQKAVADAGQSRFYRMYVVPNGGHLDTPIMNAVPEHLTELIAWSDSLRHR